MEDNRFIPPAASVADAPSSKRRLSWSFAARVWWSFLWRSAVYGFVGGVVLGALAGAVMGASGHLDRARAAGAIAGYVAGILLSLLSLKQAVEKHLPQLASFET